MRPDEAHNAQLCYWWPDYDARAGYAEFVGGASLNISAQKSDAGRTGAHKRFGKAVDPSLDFVDQMAQFHAAAGLRVGEGCTKRRNPEQRCAVCPPLWPRGHRNGVGHPLDAIQTCSGGRSPTLCGAEDLLYPTWAAFKL